MNLIIKPLDVVLRWALIALAIFMVMTVTWQVFSRYALRAPSSLTEEIARFQLIWLGLLGAVYTFRNRMHVGIDILVSPLKGKKRLAAEIFALAAMIVFAAMILIYGGSKLVALTYELNQTSAALGVKVAYVYSIIPISGVLIVLYAVHYILDIIIHGRIHKPSEVDHELDVGASGTKD
ncbi:TRAP transporter small permease [Litorimonas sp. RW-G-Af-16]|uniref:TRAP transporter small permease n=1 Tax=Litorimonas sp. RW-G-Af-16 TaxID=3241168 RepID=UPI00390CC70D